MTFHCLADIPLACLTIYQSIQCGSDGQIGCAALLEVCSSAFGQPLGVHVGVVIPAAPLQKKIHTGMLLESVFIFIDALYVNG